MVVYTHWIFVVTLHLSVVVVSYRPILLFILVSAEACAQLVLCIVIVPCGDLRLDADGQRD